MIDKTQRISENFTLDEFIESATANKKGIDNTPTLLALTHIKELVTNLLQPLRDAYGQGIKISSGYRCPRLNSEVGGAMYSAHMYGYAADIQPLKGNYDEFEQFVVQWLQESGIPFDQCIREKNGKSRWLHIGIRNGAGKQRKMLFDITD